ncbi:MAG: ShlB/FhaC/HecB family hemolysin secretion/activation protein [Gammaproteobacteria bacterium]
MRALRLLTAHVLLRALPGLLLAVAVHAAPPPVPPPLPPLPAGAQPGGAQPVVPPPILPQPETNLQLTVPPVTERPLGAAQGARVFVRQFVVTGVIGNRHTGIVPAEVQAAVDRRFAAIQKLIDAERTRLQNLQAQGPEGFTPHERAQIMQFMQGAVKTESPQAQRQAYEQFVQKLQAERLKRLQGLTIGQLQDVANVVADYYHRHGYFLARAVIPAQEVNDGIVHIRVLEGRLIKVVPKGNKLYSDATLERPFQPLLDSLVTVKQSERALLTLAQYPGLSAFGVFTPGAYVGTTDLDLNVEQERRYDANVRVDNEGTEFTGRNRLIGTVDWNNLTGDADMLRVTALKTFVPENTLFGDVRYQRPFLSLDNTLVVDLSRNSFDVSGSGVAPGTIGGISKIATLSLQHAFERSRDRNLTGTLDFSRKRADTEFVGTVIGRDDLAVLGAQLDYDSIDPALGIISTASLRLEHGLAGMFGVPSDSQLDNKQVLPPPSRFGGNGQPALPDFTRVTANYQLFKSLPRNQSLLLRLSGQYTPSMLTSLEQFVIGGVDSVRAVPTSQFLTDKGLFGSLEYSVRAPGFADHAAFAGFTWGQVLRLRVFSDAAIGILNNAVNPATKRVAVEGNGVAIEFTWPGRFTADLQWAHLNGGARPGNSATDPTAIRDSHQIWADLTFTF